MQNFMKTIISAVQTWTTGKIKDSIKNSVADWNENDSSKDSYIKNRTHWEEEKKIVVVPEQTVEGFAVMQDPIYAVGNAFSMDIPVVGETYTVNWDGADYRVVAQDGDGFIYLGNENYVFSMTSGGDIPFAIIFDDVIFVATELDAPSHTISISITKTVVHKLDSKYLDLPANIATTDDVQGAIDIANETFQNVSSIKMDKENPVGVGSFSMNRKAGTTIGDYSHAEGYQTTASGQYSHAEGYQTTASHEYSHAEGGLTVASNRYSHAEGYKTQATGYTAHAEGDLTISSGYGSHSEGRYTKASGDLSHAEGCGAIALGDNSHAEGWNTTASNRSQHVQGEYNIEDALYEEAPIVYTSRFLVDSMQNYVSNEYVFDENTGIFTLINPVLKSGSQLKDYKYWIYTNSSFAPRYENDLMYTIDTYIGSETVGNTTSYNYRVYEHKPSLVTTSRSKYAHIVGNGTSDAARSNAHTLDWSGNAWYQGDVYVGGTSQDDENASILATQEYVDNALSNVNVTTSWNDLEDKPFGEEAELIKLVERTPSSEDDEVEAITAASLNNPLGVDAYEYRTPYNWSTDFMFEVGKTYVLEVNGVQHRVVAQYGTDEYITVLIVDKIAYMETAIDIIGNGKTYLNFAWNQELGDTITIAAYEEQEIVKQLDSKYIPDDYLKAPISAQTGDLLMYNGTEWVKLSKADLIAEIISQLPTIIASTTEVEEGSSSDYPEGTLYVVHETDEGTGDE